MASEIRVNQIQSRTGVSTISFTETGPIISGVTTITGDLDVTGLVSYDDVTNIDSVGVVTARDGLQVTGGRLLVGNTSSIASLADSKIEAISGSGAEIHLARNDSSVTDGNAIGILRFYGNDGGTYQECARINCQADGTHADGDKPSRLTFYTTPSGAQTSTERLRITSSGDMGLGTATPTARLDVRRDDADGKIAEFHQSSGYGIQIRSSQSIATIRAEYNQALVFETGTTATERVRIDANGRQYHYTDGSLRMHLNATGLGVNTSTITGGRLIHAHNTGTGSAYFHSTNSNTGEGSNSGALFGVSGTTCYAPWNYINGPVVFATNASEKMRIHATGEVTKSSQPLAIIGTTSNNWAPSAGDTLPFDYSNTNRGNHYNTSNFTFTCPVAGDYMVILRLSRKGFCGDLELKKNNAQYALLELRETGRNASNAADWQAWCYDFIVPCAANDTLKWKAPSVYTGTGSGNYLLDGYNHIYYDSVTYYLMG